MKCERCGGKGVLPEAEEMKRKRESMKLGLVTAAIKMNISPSYLCDLEAGRRLWNAELLKRFDRAFK